jgi:hypothetical protein
MPGNTQDPQASGSLATPNEVAAFLRKPPKTLAEWRSRGLGPRYFKVGRMSGTRGRRSISG